MGYYINPVGQTKEEWLRDNGVKVDNPNIGAALAETNRLVCWVDNGGFTAAGIAFNQDEVDAFNQANDLRPKLWFMVDKDKLMEVCPEYKERVEQRGYDQ
jgi:hypothetical protein